jgi:hypothetical protein
MNEQRSTLECILDGVGFFLTVLGTIMLIEMATRHLREDDDISEQEYIRTNTGRKLYLVTDPAISAAVDAIGKVAPAPSTPADKTTVELY